MTQPAPSSGARTSTPYLAVHPVVLGSHLDVDRFDTFVLASTPALPRWGSGAGSGATYGTAAGTLPR